jgi:N-acetyl-gamma-glutamyl-phosphate reductase
MKSTFTRVGIIGASGYTGAELVRLLDSHPHAKVTLATASGERAGMSIGELFPSLRDVSDIVCEAYDVKRIANECDFVFVALPHGKAMEYVSDLLKAGLKICDLGADFRLRDVADFDEWYKH